MVEREAGMCDRVLRRDGVEEGGWEEVVSVGGGWTEG